MPVLGKTSVEAVASALAGSKKYQRKIGFQCFAFSQAQTPEESDIATTTASPTQPLALFAAVDQRGYVYCFDLVQNR